MLIKHYLCQWQVTETVLIAAKKKSNLI